MNMKKLYNLLINHYIIYNESGVDAFRLDKATNAATFSGTVAIANTVTTSVATVSTHKVEMVIGGVTYYLLATT